MKLTIELDLDHKAFSGASFGLEIASVLEEFAATTRFKLRKELSNKTIELCVFCLNDCYEKVGTAKFE